MDYFDGEVEIITSAGSVIGRALVEKLGELSCTADKYGVVGLTMGLRVEGAALGVKACVVCPGIINTPIYTKSKVVRFERSDF